jgi:hypothetical protein
MFFSASSLSSLLGHLLRDAEPFDARKCSPRSVQWQQLIAVMPDGPQRFAAMPGINSWGKHDPSDAQYGYPGNFAKGSLGIPRPFRETGTCSGARSTPPSLTQMLSRGRVTGTSDHEYFKSVHTHRCSFFKDACTRPGAYLSLSAHQMYCTN